LAARDLRQKLSPSVARKTARPAEKKGRRRRRRRLVPLLGVGAGSAGNGVYHERASERIHGMEGEGRRESGIFPLRGKSYWRLNWPFSRKEEQEEEKGATERAAFSESFT